MRTTDELHTDLLTLLAPITRDRYHYTGQAVDVTRVNPAGIDLHDGDARTIATAPDGTAHPYMVLAVQPTTGQHRRLVGGRSQATWGFTLRVAAGSPRGTRWAVDRVNDHLAHARLHPSTGLLEPYFDPADVIRDPDATPTRWYSPLRYGTTVH